MNQDAMITESELNEANKLIVTRLNTSLDAAVKARNAALQVAKYQIASNERAMTRALNRCKASCDFTLENLGAGRGEIVQFLESRSCSHGEAAAHADTLTQSLESYYRDASHSLSLAIRFSRPFDL